MGKEESGQLREQGGLKAIEGGLYNDYLSRSEVTQTLKEERYHVVPY